MRKGWTTPMSAPSPPPPRKTTYNCTNNVTAVPEVGGVERAVVLVEEGFTGGERRSLCWLSPHSG